jgi:hypothetical protein
MIQQKTVSSPASLGVAASNDRYLAAAMHVASIFFPILAPAIVYGLAGRSRFLKSHSYQAIFETAALKVSVFVVGAISLTYTVVRLWDFYQHDWVGFSIWPMLARFAIGWMLFGILEFANTLISIRQAFGALQGKWPRREMRRVIGNQ